MILINNEKVKDSGKQNEEEQRLGEQLKELEDKLLCVHADFDNYRKRVEKEKEEIIKTSKASLIRDILPIIDQFDLAMQQKEDSQQFRSGIELIYKNLLAVLRKEGLEEMDISDKKFDPYFHEAVKIQEGEDGKILIVIQKGYMFNGKVLRHAKVVVGRKNDNSMKR